MEVDILPCLGARPIAAIEAPELVAMTKVIEQRGAGDIAKRALETTGQVFRYAIAHGYARRNPTAEDRTRQCRSIGYHLLPLSRSELAASELASGMPSDAKEVIV
jgi:hypothetical protein